MSKEFEELKIENQLLKKAKEKDKQELNSAIQQIDDLAVKNISICGQLHELRANMQSCVKNTTILSQVESSEEMMRYYTGLNSLELFNGTFDALLPAGGFLIAEDLEKIGASLVMPTFKGTRSQLEGAETEMSRFVSNVRIHVERVIGDLRKRFTILRGPIKIRDMCIDPHDETFIDKIVTVCCCLHKAIPSVVPPY